MISAISPNQEGVVGTDSEEVWIHTETSAILVMSTSLLGTVLFFLIKEAYFYAGSLLVSKVGTGCPLLGHPYPPSEPVRAAFHGIRLSTSPEYLLLSYRDSISTSHFPLRCSSGSASTLPPRQVGFHGRYRLLSLCRYHICLTAQWSANAITASR